LFAGNVDEDVKNNYLSECYALINPSLEEGQGIVALEAMSFAKPVIGSNIPGLTEVLENEITGLTFRVCDSADLADKIIYLMENEEMAKYFGRNGYHKIRSNFLWDTIIKKIVYQYNSINRSVS
jgi:glycosyltransferase involved in cell wall biosynthesis